MTAGGSSSVSVSVFIDTSLDTRLAIVVSPSDTVADLKANLRIQHALCFPDIGDINVLSIKARRRGSFYHLSDSMLVWSAFNGIKGSWFLQMDAVSTSHQAGTTRIEMAHPLLGMSNTLCLSKDASKMPGTGNVIGRDEKDVGVKDSANVDIANDEMVSTKTKKSRKRTSAASNDQLVDKCSFLAEKEKHKGNDDPSTEPSTDPVDKSGSCIYNKEVFISENVCPESITSLHDDPSQKDCAMDEKKKKKRRKKGSSTNHQNDIHSDVPESRLIDTNAVLSVENQDGNEKPQEASIKDRNNLGKERDAPFLSGKDTRNVTGGDFLEFGSVDHLSLNNEGSNFNGTISEVGLSIHETASKYTKQGQLTDADPQGSPVDKTADPRNAYVVVTTLQEAAVDEMVSTKKKKSRKRSSTAPNDQLVDKDNSFPDKKTHKTIDDPYEQPGSDPVVQSESWTHKKEVVVTEIVRPESITARLDDPSQKDRTMDGKKKKKRKEKGASANHQNDIHFAIPESGPIDSNVFSIENHEATENHQGTSMKDHKNLGEERDAPLLSVKDTRNVVGGDYLEFVSLDSLPLNHGGSNFNGTIFEVALSIHETGGRDTKQGHLTDADPKGTLVDDNADLRTAYDAVTTLQEAAVETRPEEGTQALKNSRRRKKKHTSGSSINKQDSLHSFVENVNEDNLAPSGKNYNSRKESIGGEATLLGIHVVDESVVPSNPTDKTSKRKRKKSTKAELPSHDCIDKNHTHSFVKASTEESPRDTLEDNCKEKVERLKSQSHRDTSEDNCKEKVEMSKSLTVIGKAAVGEIPAMADSSFHADHIDENSLHRMKKSTDHEMIGKEPTEHIDSLVNEGMKESPILTLEDNLHEQGKEANSGTFLGEAATDGSHAEVDLANSSYNHDRSQDKQMNKVDFSGYSTSNNDLGHSLGKWFSRESLENAQGTTHREPENVSNSRTSDETIYNLVHDNHVDTNLNGLVIVQSNKKEYVQHSAKEVAEENTEGLLGNCHASSGRESPHNKRAAESVGRKVHRGNPNSDSDKINFLEFFVPKAVGLEVHALTQDHSSMATGSMNSTEEKTRRKRRTNLNSEDFTHNLANPSSLNYLEKNPQDDDPSKLHLVNPLVSLLDKESKTKRGYNKKAGVRASDLGAVHEIVDKKVDQKPQISNSDTYHKAPLLKDDQKKNPKEKASTVSNSKLIFDEPISESSKDGFEVCYRKSTSKPVSDNSSTSEDSNSGHEETQEGTCLKSHLNLNSSGAPSTSYGENKKATYGNILIQKKVKRSRRPLSSILRNTSSYRKARLTASQSQAEDSESQYVEVSRSSI